jgi:hypothetical protein
MGRRWPARLRAPLAFHVWISRVPCALPTSPKMPMNPDNFESYIRGYFQKGLPVDVGLKARKPCCFNLRQRLNFCGDLLPWINDHYSLKLLILKP